VPERAWKFESSPGHHTPLISLKSRKLRYSEAFRTLTCHTRVLHMASRFARPMPRDESGIHDLRKRMPLDVLENARRMRLSIPVGSETVERTISPKPDFVAATSEEPAPQARNISAPYFVISEATLYGPDGRNIPVPRAWNTSWLDDPTVCGPDGLCETEAFDSFDEIHHCRTVLRVLGQRGFHWPAGKWSDLTENRQIGQTDPVRDKKGPLF
jgi:hypothetical protein